LTTCISPLSDTPLHSADVSILHSYTILWPKTKTHPLILRIFHANNFPGIIHRTPLELKEEKKDREKKRKEGWENGRKGQAFLTCSETQNVQ